MRAKNLFMAGVTHDLRQPVHAVALHVKYLKSLGAHELHHAALCRKPAPASMHRYAR
jgi:signal transduction histidine kinase